MTQALGLSFAVLFWDYNIYFILAMTLFSGLVALGIAFWWKYSFLPLYDKNTSEHFEVWITKQNLTSRLVASSRFFG
jgi:hypothetical protein